jgi:radical SAM superfamily enzyme YgiQ (UPF0313 family)
MELTVRKGNDRFVPAGAYRTLEARLRLRAPEWADAPAVVVACFDPKTRVLPFVLYDRWFFPIGSRAIAAALHNVGFSRTRVVYELWNPNFRPSQARLDGHPIQLLMLSSMQLHCQRAYRAIRDAWTLGADRPLIVAGGPKAYYEPYHFWPLRGLDGQSVGPDVVVTGEQYVLLDLLNVVAEYRSPGDTMRTAFDRARRDRALEGVPGLVYLDPDSTWEEPVLVDTGLQRLVQCFDELPSLVLGLTLMEPGHRGAGLSPQPIPENRVRRWAMITSIQLTQGCKFNCSYCPIPAMNQKTWRYRSPESVVAEIKGVYERFGIKHFFGSDDNFFNHRQTAEEILTALARARTGDGPLGDKLRLGTEATQFDTWKNRDLLPLARRAGLAGLWFGIEDLTAELINKGQKPEVTIELFKLMEQHKIAPMPMLMYHDGQPFYTPRRLYGLYNQIAFLRQAGAVSVQCTIHSPAAGTREYEKTMYSGTAIRSLGNKRIDESRYDGNFVMVGGSDAPWLRQLKLLGAYATYYNPLNLMRTWWSDKSRLRHRRLGYQLAGMAGLIWTVVKIMPHLYLLATRTVRYFHEPPPLATVPVRLAAGAFSRLQPGTRMPPLGVRYQARGDRTGGEARTAA